MQTLPLAARGELRHIHREVFPQAHIDPFIFPAVRRDTREGRAESHSAHW